MIVRFTIISKDSFFNKNKQESKNDRREEKIVIKIF
jgi:hypothetical protein